MLCEFGREFCALLPHWTGGVGIDRAMFDNARDDFNYDEPLDEAELARFLASINAAHDGIRD